jgi:hypothetical protein
VANENRMLGGKDEVDKRYTSERQDVKWENMIKSQVVGRKSSMLEVLCGGPMLQLGTTGK